MGRSNLERHSTIGIDILPELATAPSKRQNNVYKEINGVQVKMTSQRYAVFQKSLKCVKCGLTGTFFAIERNKGDVRYHLNLYARDPQTGEEVLITKDHIIPKSFGGRNAIDNYQTMCETCNKKKGAYVPTGDLESMSAVDQAMVLTHNYKMSIKDLGLNPKKVFNSLVK